MNNLHFTGRLAKGVALTGSGDRAVAKFTLIRNDYAGKDESGGAKEKVIALQFTAFRKKAEAIAKNFYKGDQMIVVARVENNNYTDKDGDEQYGFNFIVDDFEFGSPGEEKRSLLDKQHRSQ